MKTEITFVSKWSLIDKEQNPNGKLYL